MLRWVFVCALSTAVAAATPACVPGSFASYVALGAGGCTMGPFTVNDFGFIVNSGPTPATIGVIPTTGTQMMLAFSFTGASVSGSASANYTLTYNWDPGDIRSLGDILNDPVVSPGNTTVTSVDCENSPFVGVTCPTTTDTVVVSDNGVTLNSPHQVNFAEGAVTSAGMMVTIALNGNGSGSADITGLTGVLTTPEPSTLALCLLFGAALAGAYRRRLQRR